MKLNRTIMLAAAVLGWSVPALAASDYLLEIEGVDGEASSTIEILSYSWGMSNPGSMAQAGVVAPRDVATGQSSGKRQHQPVRVTATQNSQSLRESPSKASLGRGGEGAGGVAVATGDLDGDGVADFMDATRVNEIDSFSLTFDKASPVLARMCASGKHFPKATLVARGESFELVDAQVTGCTAGAPAHRAIDSTPARISVNVTVPKQTQGATFGERCTAGACPAPELVTVTITGQMKHINSGHVTLMK